MTAQVHKHVNLFTHYNEIVYTLKEKKQFITGKNHEYYHSSPGKWLTDKRLEYAKAVKLFQKNGWNVVASMRSPENETELSKLNKLAGCLDGL